MANTKQKDLSHTPSHIVKSVLGTGLFAALCILIAFPLLAGLLASFRPGTELIRKGLAIDLNPSTMTLSNYAYLFGGNEDSRKYFMWYKNSLLITFFSVVLTLIICYFVAYGLTMYEFRFKNLLFTLVIATMMVPFEILMLPMYKEIIALHLIDTYVGVIITGLCSASTIFFFRQYLSGLPKELLSAARIDGANEYYISVKIILPLAKPAFASMGILSAMGAWNAILWPLLVLKGAQKFTLPIGLNTLLTPYGNNYDVLIAGSMFGILPIFVIFLIFQKYIIDGMTAGAVKG
ncbi:MAG: carbohydrate ABC transporter permease [Lachnospiraceae bacterium]|nr:carbohydrate ABC transporter permease [Lachnospiraceae bacterium]